MLSIRIKKYFRKYTLEKTMELANVKEATYNLHIIFDDPMQHLTIQTGTTNQVLRQKSEPITVITKDIKKLVKEMEVAMLEKNGIGLAAPQVGIHKRLILITLFPEGKRKKGEEKIIAMVNPEITAYSMETDVAEEGCLSVPGVYDDVERYSSIEVAFLDLNGNKMKMKLSGLHAREVQHEIDHLDGILFTDYLEKQVVALPKKMTKTAQK